VLANFEAERLTDAKPCAGKQGVEVSDLRDVIDVSPDAT
jgi:hypothetical protein